jgi:hypothetical protein
MEKSEAGKLFLLDFQPETNRKQKEMLCFFDDNILPHDPHIVDARDMSQNGKQIAFEDEEKKTFQSV